MKINNKTKVTFSYFTSEYEISRPYSQLSYFIQLVAVDLPASFAGDDFKVRISGVIYNFTG